MAKRIVVICLILFFCVGSSQAALPIPQLILPEPVDKTNHVVFKFCSENIVFDFYEPEIPVVYELSVETDHERINIIEKRMLDDYCANIKYLKKLYKTRVEEKNRHTGEIMTEYKNEYGGLSIFRNLSKIGFHDYYVKENPKLPDLRLDQVINVAEKFIEKYGGGIENLVPYSVSVKSVVFKETFAGVLVTGFSSNEVCVNMTNEGKIYFFVRDTHLYKKLRMIKPEEIFPASEAVRMSEESIVNWYTFREPIQVGHPRLVYLLNGTKIQLVWQFYVDEQFPLYLDAKEGGVVHHQHFL